MKYYKKSLLVLISVLMVILFASCGKKINTDEIKKYSDPALENILLAGNKNDYLTYSKDFSDKMKEALTEKVFNDQNKIIKDKIGDYESKEFLKAQLNGEYIVAIYNAKYSNEDKVVVTISFKNKDENHKVEGLFMTSPKLAAK